MKFKLTKTLIFACIIMSSHWGFAQTFDRDAERNNRRNSSTEEVTGVTNSSISNKFHQLGTNFQILSNIGANIEYTAYNPISKPNEMGDQALYLGSTYGIGYGSVNGTSVSLLSANVDMTLNYKFPINDDNLKILLGAGAGYYSIFLLGSTGGGDSNGDFIFVARSSVSYFFAPTIGVFGSATKAGSGDISFSAGLVFRKAR